MTLNRRVLKRVHSPIKSPKKSNSTLRKKALIKQISDQSNDVQFGAASKANLKVVVRVRPQNSREYEQNARTVVKIVDRNMLVFDPKEEDSEFFFQGVRQQVRDLNKRPSREQKFIFENVFGEVSTNQEVFEETTKDIVDTLLDGYNCSVFAYGATGAGKTFTMLGKPETPGITFLTVMELYRRIEELKEQKTCEVGISYLEVYNEMVRDLLKPGKMLNVQDSGQQVLVPGLSLHKTEDAEDLMQMLALGNLNRSQHPTDANAESSRSHAVFQVFVRQQARTANVKSSISIAKLSMIDLAGSERGASTGFTGARFREGANINKSLLALGNCINALADGQRHIPYRDSKLTRLLKDSLGGNCRSVMIAAISSASPTFEDTFNTLRYANRAKTIKMTVKRNILNVDQHVSQYLKIVEDLRDEITNLKGRICLLVEEKQKVSEAQEEELQRLKGVSVRTDQELGEEKRLEMENRISELEEKLSHYEVKAKTAEVSEEERQLQTQLLEAWGEYKSLRRDVLQMESYRRELELKVRTCQVHAKRMSIFTFASTRLEKSVAKCEKTIRKLHLRLQKTDKHRENVQAKLDSSLSLVMQLQALLEKFGPEGGKLSASSQVLIQKCDSQLAMRDMTQQTEYLQGVIKEGIIEQAASEQLITCLLSATRQFYVQLYANNLCNSEMKTVFEGVTEMLDKNRVAWADLQSQESSQVVSGSSEGNPINIDLSWIVNLPVGAHSILSPAVPFNDTMCRQSIIKPTSSSFGLPMRTEIVKVKEEITAIPSAVPAFNWTSMTSSVIVPSIGVKCESQCIETPMENTVGTDFCQVAANEESIKVPSPKASSTEMESVFISLSDAWQIRPASGPPMAVSTSLNSTYIAEDSAADDVFAMECSLNSTFGVCAGFMPGDMEASLTPLDLSVCGTRVQSHPVSEDAYSLLDSTVTLDQNSGKLDSTFQLEKRTSLNEPVVSRPPLLQVNAGGGLMPPPVARPTYSRVLVKKTVGNAAHQKFAMRRSVSTSSLDTSGQKFVPGNPSGPHGAVDSTVKKKPVGAIAGALQRTTSFLKPRFLSNQENLPPATGRGRAQMGTSNRGGRGVLLTHMGGCRS